MVVHLLLRYMALSPLLLPTHPVTSTYLCVLLYTSPSPLLLTPGEASVLSELAGGASQDVIDASAYEASAELGKDVAMWRDSVPAVHCYHGFGANLGSYKRVQENLAAVLRGVVTAHDMPGFGLTQRWGWGSGFIEGWQVRSHAGSQGHVFKVVAGRGV